VSDASEIGGEARGSAVQRSFRLMQVLAQADGAVPLADLADQVDLPRPSAHRLLQQMEEVGFVRRDLSGRGYTVGPAWLRLAVEALGAAARRPPIRDLMRQLVDEVKESCNLGIVDDHEVLYLERVECDWPLRMQLSAGSRVPLHCTAAGKLLLAAMPLARRTRLLSMLKLDRHTDNTIVTPEALEAECAAIRERGFSVNAEEYHRGLIGIAVPVRRADGAVVAALSIHAPIFRMSVEEAQRHLPRLRAAAERIALELGLLSE
jgi:DNA-binding IclR family transcriptional regulator